MNWSRDCSAVIAACTQLSVVLGPSSLPLTLDVIFHARFRRMGYDAQEGGAARMPQMKQLALDIGMAHGPPLARFYAGRNAAGDRPRAPAGWATLWRLRVAHASAQPILWGEAGSGKTICSRPCARLLREQGVQVGWMDASHRFSAGVRRALGRRC